jgi:hypothetical protein
MVNELVIGAYLILALYIAYVIYSRLRDKKLLERVTDKSRGTKSERHLVLKLLKYGMSEQAVFHDLYLEKYKGAFSQIDLVALTEVGIIVFEVKDYSGWLFGSGNQSKWTQVLAYGKQKYRFFNPVIQNNRHISELRKKLIQFGDIPFYSMVVFYGDCVLKEIDFLPNGTFIVKSERVLEVVKLILRDNQKVHYSNRTEIARILKEAVTNGGIRENINQHSENIKDMLGKHRVFD